MLICQCLKQWVTDLQQYIQGPSEVVAVAWVVVVVVVVVQPPHHPGAPARTPLSNLSYLTTIIWD